MLPVVFEEFKMVYIFLLLVFLFTIIFDFSTTLGRAAAPPFFTGLFIIWTDKLLRRFSQIYRKTPLTESFI